MGNNKVEVEVKVHEEVKAVEAVEVEKVVGEDY